MVKNESGYDYLDDCHMTQRSTGEVVPALWAQLPVGSISYTPEQQKAYKARKERESARKLLRQINSDLGKFYFADAGHTYEDIKPENMARLIFLATFLPYGKQELKNGHYKMTKQDLKKVTGLCECTFFHFWHDVFGKYLFEDEKGYIYLSKDFSRGEIVNHDGCTERQKIYIQAIRALYKSCPVSRHKYLGRVFQMLPYINIEYNILCHNPFENNISNVRCMTVDEFCGLIGLVDEKRARMVRDYGKICFPVGDHTERFCSFVLGDKLLNDARIVVNPHILYRGSNWEKVKVLGAFTAPQSA